MKRMFKMFTALLMATAMLTACNGGKAVSTVAPEPTAAPQEPTAAPDDTDSGTDTAKGISIALLNASNGNAWRAQMEEEMNALVKDYMSQGLVSNYVAYSANDDATTQSQQLSQIISAANVDVVIINPVSATSLNPVIDKALDAGIIVLGVDSVISHEGAITLATDQYEWAKVQAEKVAEVLDGKGNIIVYEAAAGNPASDTREQAFHDVLANFPDIKVLKEVYHGWDEGEAKQLTTTMISTFPEIDGILNQDCSPGIMQGFQEAGKDMPKVITSDGSVTYLNMWNDYNIKNPDKAFESIIVGNPPGIGCSAIKIAVRLAQGKVLKEDALTDRDGGKALLLAPNPIITNENREEWVEKTKEVSDAYTFTAVLTDEEVDAFFQ